MKNTCPDCKKNHKRMETLARKMEDPAEWDEDLYLEEKFDVAARAVCECDCEEK